MKKRVWIGLVAATFVTVFGLTSCSENNVDPATNQNNETLSSSYELLVAPVDFTDATIEQEMDLRISSDMQMNSDMESDMDSERGSGMGSGMESDMGSGRDSHMGSGMGSGREMNMDPNSNMPLCHPFSRLIKALKLTDAQLEQVRGFLADHDTCVRTSLSELYTSMRGIIQRAKEARQEVIAAMRAGDITREEAREKIRTINQGARAALKDSGVREKIREAMKICDDEFLASLKSILTEEQLAILDRFLASRSTGTRG